MKSPLERRQCKENLESVKHSRKDIPGIVEKLVASCNKEGRFDHVSAEPIPIGMLSLMCCGGRAASFIRDFSSGPDWIKRMWDIIWVRK